MPSSGPLTYDYSWYHSSVSGTERPVSQIPSSIELSVDSALAQSLRTADEQGVPLMVDAGDRIYTVFVERVALDGTDREAALAAAGSWKDLIDADALKKQLKDARGSKRLPAAL